MESAIPGTGHLAHAKSASAHAAVWMCPLTLIGRGKKNQNQNKHKGKKERTKGMSAKKLNVEMLKEIARLIVKFPDNFNMDSFTSHNASCGTTGCIAGWACALDYAGKLSETPLRGLDLTYRDCDDPDETAKRLLGLSNDCAAKLFFTDEWPMQFEDAYNNAVDHKEEARVTAKRIRHFIEHGE